MASDEELMTDLADGNPDALAELLGRYEHAVTGFVRRQTGGRDVEDLYQETWLRVVRSAGRFDPSRKFSTWLFQIALNLCRDWRRRRPPPAVAVAEDLDRGATDSPSADAAELARIAPPALARREAAIDAARLLERLGPEHREVLELRYYQDLSERDVSRILDIPPGTVKSRLHAALKALARFVAETPIHTIAR